MITYLLGSIYEARHQLELRKKYYALSATSDLKNANKDNASLQELALVFYEIGDVDMAYKLTQSAIEDALYCNVQFRTLLMSEVYSIINTVYLEKEAKRKTELQLYLVMHQFAFGIFDCSGYLCLQTNEKSIQNTWRTL